MSESGTSPKAGPLDSTFVRWVLGIIAGLLTILVVALWNGNATLAVVVTNTANIKEIVIDHEQRMRRLERQAQRRQKSTLPSGELDDWSFQ